MNYHYHAKTCNPQQTLFESLVLFGYLQQSVDYLRLCSRPRT